MTQKNPNLIQHSRQVAEAVGMLDHAGYYVNRLTISANNWEIIVMDPVMVYRGDVKSVEYKAVKLHDYQDVIRFLHARS